MSRQEDAQRAWDSGEATIYSISTSSPGPAGQLPLEPKDLLERPSGDVFGWSLNVGMGWAPAELRRPEALILSTQGGIREPDGTPLALGYHTGHWEVGLLMRAAAETLRASGWRGSGYVRWSHPENHGFLGALDGLRRLADRIGEREEAARCAEFLKQLDPKWRAEPDGGSGAGPQPHSDEPPGEEPSAWRPGEGERAGEQG